MKRCIGLIAACLFAFAAEASVTVARLPRSALSSRPGNAAFVIDLHRGVGFDISLLATGERICDWWVDDPSRVVARLDRSSRVLSLRLVQVPALLPSNRRWTTLKLLIGDATGRLELLAFVVRFHDRAVQPGDVRYHGLEIVPAAPVLETGPTSLR